MTSPSRRFRHVSQREAVLPVVGHPRELLHKLCVMPDHRVNENTFPVEPRCRLLLSRLAREDARLAKRPRIGIRSRARPRCFLRPRRGNCRRLGSGSCSRRRSRDRRYRGLHRDSGPTGSATTQRGTALCAAAPGAPEPWGPRTLKPRTRELATCFRRSCRRGCRCIPYSATNDIHTCIKIALHSYRLGVYLYIVRSFIPIDSAHQYQYSRVWLAGYRWNI